MRGLRRTSEPAAVPLHQRGDKLQALVTQRAAIVAYKSGCREVEAYAVARPSRDPVWHELEFWIAPEKIDDISATALLCQLISKRPPEWRYFHITRDPLFVSAAKQIGFTIIERGVKPGDREPIDWAYETGIVCRLPKTVHRPASVHGSDEVLLVR